MFWLSCSLSHDGETVSVENRNSTFLMYWFCFLFSKLYELQSITNNVWALRRGVMVSNLILRDQLRQSSAFDPHWIPHTFGFMPHLSYSRYNRYYDTL